MNFFDKLKYTSGCKPGQKRKTEKTNDETAAQKKKYENNRVERKFQNSWQKNRPWLLYDETLKIMKCQTCIDFYGSNYKSGTKSLNNANAFLTGCSNMKSSTVEDHEKCNSHRHASERQTAKAQSGDELLSSSAGKALQILHASQRHRLAFLFRNAHAVAKQNRPLSDYEWLCKIDKAKDLDIGATYLNRKAALVFLSSVAGAERMKTVKLLKESKFYAFMMDGTTDISGDEQEAIYVRTALNGKIEERFLSIGTPNTTSSADLYDFSMKCFEENDIEKDKLVGLGSDGASNMTGVRKGLAALLKQNVNSELINIHCLAHRLELAFRDVVKNNKMYDKLMSLLIGLHYFYKKHYKNKSGLIRTMEALQLKGTLPPKVTGTRWLPHLSRGIKSLLTTYRAYEAHLSTISHSNPKAEGMVKFLYDKQLMAFTLFLKDALEPLMVLSLKLQSPKNSFADSIFWVETTTDMLDELKLRENEDLKCLLNLGTLQGIQLKGRTPEMVYKETLIESLKDAITTRFNLDDKNVINSTKITNLHKWPESDKHPDFLEFGVEEVNSFAAHFSKTLERACPEFDVEEAVSQWRTLKRAVYKRYGSKLITKTWADLCDKDLQFITLVIDLMLTIPPTSVNCETTFSQLKLVKTCRRTRLQQSTLNDLLIVKLQSPNIEIFNPEPAIDHWLASALRSRRPDYVRKPLETAKSSETVSAVPEIIELEIENNDQVVDNDDGALEDDIEELQELFGGKYMDDEDYCEDFMSEEDNFAKIMMYMRDC